jgi:CHAT domain-containing protein/Tfp pilus assembly protein PilF
VAGFATLGLSCSEDSRTPDPLARIQDHITQGRYAEAQEEGRALLARAEATQGADSPEVAAVLDKLVEALWRADRLGEETFALARRAVSIREAALGPDHLDTATSLNNLGSVYLMAGRYDQATLAYGRAYGIRLEALGRDHHDVAVVLNNIAQVEYVLGDFAAAREKTEEAIRIFTVHYGAEHPRVADLVDNLGRILLRQGDPEQAAYYIRKALEVLEPSLGPEHPTVLSDKSLLADALRDQGRPDDAIPLLLAISDVQAASLGTEHSRYLATIESLGNAYLATGHLDEAKHWRARILEIRERAWPDHPFTGSAHYNYGRVLYFQREFPEAKQRFERALELRRKWYGERHFTVASALPYLAYTELELGDPATALDHAIDAAELAREQFSVVAASLSEKEALRLERIRRHGIDAALRILSESPLLHDPAAIRSVWDQIVRSRALVLDDVIRRKREAARSTDPRTEERIAMLEQARAELAKLLVASPTDDAAAYQRQLHDAEERRARAERELAALGISGAFQDGTVGIAEVAAALPRDAALVAYVRYGRTAPAEEGRPPVLEPVPHYLAFVADARGVAALPLGPAEPIEAAIRDWKRLAERRPSVVPLAARQAEAAYAAAAERLAELSFRPIAARLSDAREWIVVPDGAVHLVSFSTLVDERGAYLAESGPAFHYLSAERDLVRARAGEGANHGLFALGGAEFGPRPPQAPPADTDCPGLAGLAFDPLDPSRAEVEALAASWRAAARGDEARTHVATGAQATETAVRTLGKEYRVVHLATHGFFAEDLCAPPEASDPLADSSERLAVRILRDPLILSGLALAGANARQGASSPADDGLLTAEEVASLDLAGVEWVVLSACKTGLGEVQGGEGVLGLRRAFETAGARTLIMSLWAVDDEATRAWMTSLYAGRLSGASTVEAVRRATRETIAARRAAGRSTHPFFWGAFVAVGDPR